MYLPFAFKSTKYQLPTKHKTNNSEKICLLIFKYSYLCTLKVVESTSATKIKPPPASQGV